MSSKLMHHIAEKEGIEDFKELKKDKDFSDFSDDY